jgi:xanthine dehydrogenase accessory factor
MSDALRALAARRLASCEPAVVLEVVATRGSVPRETGTRMLVWADGSAGTIGGGHLEWRALATARAMLADQSLRPDDERFALGASLGQCCGGAVTLRYRMLDAASLATWNEAAIRPTIQVYGAGHVGRAVVHLLGTLAVRVQWIDERADEFPDEASPSNIERVCVDPVEAEVDVAPQDAFHLVFTHRHDLDLRIVEAILRRGDFAFLGLIGSLTKRRRFTQLLRERGIDEATLARMTCPIGITAIEGKEPAHIAIAVVAQLLPMIEAAVARVDAHRSAETGTGR